MLSFRSMWSVVIAAVVSLGMGSSLLAAELQVTVNLAWGNKYVLKLVKSGDEEDKKDKAEHAAVVGNAIRVCGGWDYDFEYTAIPAPDWEVVKPAPNPSTVQVHPDKPDSEEKIGQVEFRHTKGKEAAVRADVLVLAYSRKLTQFGRVDKKFSANLKSADIEKQITAWLADKLKADKAALMREIRKIIDAAIRRLPTEVSVLFVEIEIQKAAQEALDQVVAIIEKGIDAYNAQVDKLAKKIASELKNQIDKAAPELQFSSNYGYRCGFRDPGDPGWSGDLTIELMGLKNVKAGGTIGFEYTTGFKITPLGVGISGDINVTLKGAASAGTEFRAIHPLGPTPVDSPVATVGATPAMDVTVELSGLAGYGVFLGVEGSLTISTELTDEPIQATLEAGKRTKE